MGLEQAAYTPDKWDGQSPVPYTAGPDNLYRAKPEPDRRIGARFRGSRRKANAAEGWLAACPGVAWQAGPELAPKAGFAFAAWRIGFLLPAAATRERSETQARSTAGVEPRPWAHRELRSQQPWPRGPSIPHFVSGSTSSLPLPAFILSNHAWIRASAELPQSPFSYCWKYPPTGPAVGRCCSWSANPALRLALRRPADDPSR